jgi:FixJ family two-component response regulator
MPVAKPVLAVLDDEPEMRKALRRLLSGRGFEVAEYAVGRDLIAGLGSRPWDCLLLDLHMTEVSGFDVLEAFRAQGVRVPVVVITAHDEPGTAARVQALGACSYLKKPVDGEVLVAAITDAIAQFPARIRSRGDEP